MIDEDSKPATKRTLSNLRRARRRKVSKVGARRRNRAGFAGGAAIAVPPRMRIALVCDWYLPRIGGIESYLRDLARALLAHGHEPEVITATPGAPVVDGVTVHRLPLPRLPGWDVIFAPRTVERVRELLATGNFDLVHGHSLYSPLAHVTMMLAWRMGIPSVLSSHSLLRPAGVLGFDLCNGLAGWARWPGELTAVSSLAAAEARVASGRERVHVLPNGIDAPPAIAALDASHGRAPTVISVMRLTRRKQPLELLRALSRIDALVPERRRPRLIVVGDGPLFGELERLAQRLGLRDRVDLVGAVPRLEARKLLARADVFALPTVKEAFGIAVLEARAAGLPVVAMRTSGAADLVEHEKEGLLADGPHDFAACLARLLTDEPLRAKLARASRRGLEPFSWERVLARHLEIYALALGRGRVAKAA
jgi:glycosyltransferase involved in cell wall biosynthesis